jgi:hypothetical protein
VGKGNGHGRGLYIRKITGETEKPDLDSMGSLGRGLYKYMGEIKLIQYTVGTVHYKTE